MSPNSSRRSRSARASRRRRGHGSASSRAGPAAANPKSLDAVAMAKALQGFELPPEVALSPNKAFYRAAQNQLIATIFVGAAQASGDTPDDLFHVTRAVDGADIAGTVEESGCKMTWPS